MGVKMAVFVFGSNLIAQLGLGYDEVKTAHPMKLEIFDKVEVKKVKCGMLHTLLVTQDGKLYSWGCNDEWALGRDGEESVPELVQIPKRKLKKGEAMSDELLEKVVDVACGGSVSVALCESGALYSWGTFRNANGVLGFSKATRIQKYPVKMRIKNVVGLECGSNHVLLLTKTNKLISYGVGDCGEIGRKTSQRNKVDSLIPQEISTRRKRKLNEKFIKVRCGLNHSMAINDSNELFCWGKNLNGQLGNKETVNTFNRIKIEIKDVQDADGGTAHTLILLKNGELYSVGKNDCGQLGTNDTVDSVEIKKVISGVKKISTCTNFNLALIGNKLHSWGANFFGELGYEEEDSFKPKEIPFDFGEVIDFSVGNDFSVVYSKK